MIINRKDFVIVQVIIEFVDAAIKMLVPFGPEHTGIIELPHDFVIIDGQAFMIGAMN